MHFQTIDDMTEFYKATAYEVIPPADASLKKRGQSTYHFERVLDGSILAYSYDKWIPSKVRNNANVWSYMRRSIELHEACRDGKERPRKFELGIFNLEDELGVVCVSILGRASVKRAKVWVPPATVPWPDFSKWTDGSKE